MKLNFNDSVVLNAFITIVLYALYAVNLYNLTIAAFPFSGQLFGYAFWAFPIISLFFTTVYFIKVSRGHVGAKLLAAIHLTALILFFVCLLMLLSKIE